MDLFLMTISHRNTNDVQNFVFIDYASARRYCNELKKYSSLLNGFTVRRLRLNRASGVFDKVAVMYHIRFEDVVSSK